MTIKEVIHRIGYFRNKQNISARELSLRLGKHDTYINKLESHDFNLPVSVLLQIIESLGITEEEFFAQNFTDYKQDNEITTSLTSLPTDSKHAILSLIRQLEQKNTAKNHNTAKNR